MMRKIRIVATLLTLIFAMGCSDGNIRDFLNEVKPFFDGTNSAKNLSIEPGDSEFTVHWTADATRYSLQILDDNNVSVLNTTIDAGIDNYTYLSATNFEYYRIRMAPIVEDTDIIGAYLEQTVMPGVIFCNPNALASGTGSSFEHPMINIASAINAADDLGMTSVAAQVRLAGGTFDSGATITCTDIGSSVSLVGGYDPVSGVITEKSALTGAGIRGVMSLDISAGASVLLENIIIQNGSATQGAGIDITNQGALSCIRCEFINNVADGAGLGGGAIFIQDGLIDLDKCLFIGNEATNGDSGALFADSSSIVLSNSVFFENASSYLAGGQSLHVMNTGESIIIGFCSFYSSDTINQYTMFFNRSTNVQVLGCAFYTSSLMVPVHADFISGGTVQYCITNYGQVTGTFAQQIPNRSNVNSIFNSMPPNPPQGLVADDMRLSATAAAAIYPVPRNAPLDDARYDTDITGHIRWTGSGGTSYAGAYEYY